MRLTAYAAVAAVLVAGALPVQAGIVFDQGFEVDESGWLDTDVGGRGIVDRVGSGTNGITSFAGSFHAVFQQSGSFDTGCCGFQPQGAFTQFDGYRSVFPGTYTAQAAIFLDTTWNAGNGFDYSVASNGSDGNHQRDFIFHVTQDTSSGQLLVGASNNTNFDPREDLDTLSNNFAVTQSDWYVFEHVFRNDGGVLAVDLNLYSSGGSLLFTETRSDPTDTIPGEVGGNRYGWFTNIDVDGGIAVDDTQLEIAMAVPAPASLPLFAIALGVFATARRARRQRGA